MTSIGHLKSKRLRGRMFNCSAMTFKLWLFTDRSVPLGQVLANQAVDVFVAAALPGAVRVAEVDRHTGSLGDLGVPRHFTWAAKEGAGHGSYAFVISLLVSPVPA